MSRCTADHLHRVTRTPNETTRTTTLRLKGYRYDTPHETVCAETTAPLDGRGYVEGGAALALVRAALGDHWTVVWGGREWLVDLGHSPLTNA